MNDKLSLNCIGTEIQEGGGGKSKQVVVVVVGGSAEREGVFVCDGQNGSARVITREDNGLVSLQAAGSRCAATEQASDLQFVLCSVCNHGFIHLLLFVLAHGATE